MHTLYKPDGTPVKVNENSLPYALALGWTEKNPKEQKPKRARKPRAKAE